MRVLIAFLIVLGGIAAIFYETRSERPDRWSEPKASETRAFNADTFDSIPRRNDQSGSFRAADSGLVDPSEQENPPSFAPPPPRQAEGQSNPLGAPIDADNTRKQIEVLRQSLAITLLRERNQARRASDALGTAAKKLQAALKERGDIAARVSDLGAQAATLQASIQAKAEEINDVRRQLAAKATRDATASADYADLQNQIVSSKGRADEAVATERETQVRLAKSEALAGQLQSKLDQLDAAGRQMVAQTKDELAKKDARYSVSMSKLSEKLRLIEAKLRGSAADRNAAISRAAWVAVQQRLAASALWAARLALTNTNVRAAAAQSAAALSAPRARQLADGKEALSKRLEEAAAQIDAMKGERALATKAAVAMQAQLQGLTDVRRRLAEQAKQDASADTNRAGLQSEIVSLKSEADEAAVTKRETQARLSASEALVGQLKGEIAGLDAKSRQAASRTKDELAQKDAAADRYSVGVSELSEKLRLAEVKVRDLTTARDATISRIAWVTARERLAAAGLWAARLALTNANVRAATEQRATALSSNRVQQVAESNDILRRRLEEAGAQIDAKRGELAQATRAAAAMQVQLGSLTASDKALQAERQRAALTAYRPLPRQAAARAPEGPLLNGRDKPDQASPATKQPVRSPVVSRPNNSSAGSTLPDALAAHVLLRYAHDKARPQALAKTLLITLGTLGVEVTEAPAAGIMKAGESVTYFYAQDRSIANRIAQQIEAPAPIQSHSVGSRASRPGTIEVMIGG